MTPNDSYQDRAKNQYSSDSRIITTVAMREKTGILHLILIAMTLASLTTPRIIEVTTANVQLVIRSVTNLHLLLNSPSCPHSQTYADHYLSINTQSTIGIANCDQDQALCQYLNVTHYPTLLLVSSQEVKQLNQYQYLVENKVVEEGVPELLLQDVLGYLKDERKWVAVVLEEEHLPIIDRINDEGTEGSEKRVVYVSNPSKLHQVLFGLTGGQLGCWILVNNNSTFHRHFCGNGYKSEQLQKHLNNFIANKSERHIFTKQLGKDYLEHAMLSQIINDLGRKQSTCKLVYFYSKHCQHCDLSDFDNIKSLAKQNRAYKNHQVQIFNLDNEEYPQGLRLLRLPELVEFCNAKARYFGNVFALSKLGEFITNSESGFSMDAISNEL